jgi:hypothetical protein
MLMFGAGGFWGSSPRASTARRWAAATAVAMAIGIGSPAVLASTALAGTGLGSTGPNAGQHWHTSLRVAGAGFPAFTAAAATGAGSAWAFDSQGTKSPGAYQFGGSHWTKRSFPAKASDFVTSASASSAGNVWAFTFDGAALRYNGHSWSQVKKFSREIDSGLTVSSTDTWVFGSNLGTWHFNGHGWKRFPTAKGLEGASALSATGIWAFGGTRVAHWNGHAWLHTNLAGLLPKNTQLSRSLLTAIYASSPSSIWVAGSGGRQDEGGPLVLLHYNGHSWSRVAEDKSLGDPTGIVADGHGGAWISVRTGEPGEGSVERYSSGKLTSAKLPVSPAHLFLYGMTTAKGSTAPLAFGYARTSPSPKTTTAVILRYGT